MKFKVLCVAALLFSPVRAVPQIYVSSCDVRVILARERNAEGQMETNPRVVRFIVPCVTKDQLRQILGEVLISQKPEIKEDAVNTLRGARVISLTLTTRPSQRKLKD
jgi:hypothetical protein